MKSPLDTQLAMTLPLSQSNVRLKVTGTKATPNTVAFVLKKSDAIARNGNSVSKQCGGFRTKGEACRYVNGKS